MYFQMKNILKKTLYIIISNTHEVVWSKDEKKKTKNLIKLKKQKILTKKNQTKKKKWMN
jgi:hypothetical protein